MIIKVIKRAKESSFERLGRYILSAKGNESILFTRTAEYVMDLKGDGEKIAWYRITNCKSDAPAIAIAEVLATQAENQRSKSDKTYHLVVSLREGEQLSREQGADIEDSICTHLGFEGHQRVSAVHKDTDNFHIHIAINKINPNTHCCIEPYFSFYKLDSLAKELELKHGLLQDNRIGKQKSFAKVGELEAHQQQESFLRWLHKNLDGKLSEVLQNGRSWDDIHNIMSQYGAVIKPRGAGLVVATVDGAIGIKASSLDRKLSFKALTDRFGEYLPPKDQVKQITQYQLSERKLPGMSPLYDEYKKSRETNYEGRTKALDELRAEHSEQRIKLKDWYQERRVSIKSNMEMTAQTKRTAYQELFEEMKKDLAKHKQLEQEQKKVVREKFPARTWDEYLINRAESGHVEALAVLRNRQDHRQQICEALLTVENIEEAKHVINAYFEPTVLRNGRVIYRAKDGGVVFDETTAISVPSVTEASTLLALSLADERFKDKAVVVEGTDDFKLQVAMLSALEGLSIKLADPVLEKERQFHVRAKQLSEEAIKQNIEEKKDQQLEQERDLGQDYRSR